MELADGVALGRSGVGALDVIGPEVFEHGAVDEHVPDGDDHGMFNGHQCPHWPFLDLGRARVPLSSTAACPIAERYLEPRTAGTRQAEEILPKKDPPPK